ncbi:hypothetical protein [Chondromyces apiculatus]|uniref:Kazal-type serine protease inhibitor domain protein n=1 Tax=Chondromyces apiculatus DSM 436 TaxID=1192034 RepID=A0A017TIK3_9BACT|nr:hypothetical protein [Chondromyces apiculatus]EYF08456.1 Kazal-type serine protease inhibitor domain protein [Chondromyces apiculatus DSM 436]
MKHFAHGLLIAVLAVACGSTVEDPNPNSTSGGDGGRGAGGGAGGGTPSSCDLFSDPGCGDGETCVHADGSCGSNDSGGLCTPRPTDCELDCPGVCGCDAQFYCNECYARMAGNDVSSTVLCDDPITYSAQYAGGGHDNIVLLAADGFRNFCVKVFLQHPAENAAGFDFTLQQGWGVSRVEMTGDYTDCAQSQPDSAPSRASTGGRGTVSWELEPNTVIPCTIDVSAVAHFPPSDNLWHPTTLPLSATDIPVDGGCQ